MLVNADRVSELLCPVDSSLCGGEIEFCVHNRLDLRLGIYRTQLFRGPWEAVAAFSDLSLFRHSDTSQEVGDVRSIIADESCMLHKWPCLISRAIVYLFAIVQNQDLVEEVKDAVASLVECDYGRQSKLVGQGPQSACEVERTARIQSSGRIVPAEHT